jgi:alcohol dehydrogenase class IV
MGANIRALQARVPDHPALARYRETAVLLTGREAATPEEGVDWVRQLLEVLALPSLGRLGFAADQTAEAVAKARQASSMKGNPVSLTENELTAIFQVSL